MSNQNTSKITYRQVGDYSVFVPPTVFFVITSLKDILRATISTVTLRTVNIEIKVYDFRVTYKSKYDTSILDHKNLSATIKSIMQISIPTPQNIKTGFTFLNFSAFV